MRVAWCRALAAGGALLALAVAGPICDRPNELSVAGSVLWARPPPHDVVVAWRGAAAHAAAALLRAALLAAGHAPPRVRLARYNASTCELVHTYSWLLAPALRLAEACARGAQRVLVAGRAADALQAAAAPAPALRALSEAVLEVPARSIYDLLLAFEPTAADLQAVQAAPSPEEEACSRVRPAPPADMPWAGLVLCDDEDWPLYQNISSEVATYIEESLKPQNLSIDYRWLLPPVCPTANDDTLSKWVEGWNRTGRLWSLVGVAVPAEMARLSAAAARLAGGGVRVLPYTAAAEEEALRRLAAACGWRRVAVLLAGDEACPAAAAPAVRCYPAAADAAELDATLAAALALGVRIWYVSGAAGAVLARAAALGLTRAEGHVWLVRAAAAAARGVLPLRPMLRRTVRPDWRPALAARLAARWPEREWPPHAVSIADAMLALAEGMLAEHANDTHDFPEIKNASMRDGGVAASPINIDDFSLYIDEWSEDTGAWSVGSRPLADGECPVSATDGLSACAAPVGDPFAPRCLDWLAGAALLLAAAARAGGALAAAARAGGALAAAARAGGALAAAARAGGALAARRWRARTRRRLRQEHFRAVLARYCGAFAALEPHLVDRGTLELRALIGEGSFGRVHLGVLAGRPSLPVAVKELRAGAAPAAEAEFMREASTLAGLRHEHVVRFVGVCAADGPPLLLMEHAFHGDLQRYLRARRHLAEGATGAGGGAEAEAVGPAALTRLAREAAAALAHLAERGLVHRDVRAANCLVDARRSLKLADFGMARAVGAADGEYACRRDALFPVLWMAPETLARGVSSPASDVWALAVLALELVTLGERPWGALAPPAVVRAVKAGARPPLPPDASGALRTLAAACWRRDPAARPLAAGLAAWLARRPRALRPALRPPAAVADADSGLGEPSPPDIDADAL